MTTVSDYECIETEPIGGGRIIRLQRPERRNALSNRLIAELTDAVSRAAADPALVAIVLTGAGPAFSAGADLSEAVLMDSAEFLAWNRRFRALTDAIEQAPKPVIAAIAGYCFTGGLELALACDVRFAADSASFAITSARIGSVAGFGGTQRLPRLIGPARAKRMLFRAEPVDADAALEFGLVDEVVPAAELLAVVEREVRLYSTRGPISLAMAKRAVDLGMQMDLRSGLEVEATIVAPVFDTEDKSEGMRAFLEKRSPKFQGR